MTKLAIKKSFTIGLLAMLLSLPALAASVNKSVVIDAGSRTEGASSVNGSIEVRKNAVVTGGVQTVNGTVRIDSGARVGNASTVNGSLKLKENVEADSLSTVNGTIEVGEKTTIDGSIEAVNGAIYLRSGASVAADVENVNGKITLSGAAVGGSVTTVSGDVFIVEGSVVAGDLIIEKPGGWGWNHNKRLPRVVVGPDSIVRGNIKLEHEVKLFISVAASVGDVIGVMSLQEAVRFSGDKP